MGKTVPLAERFWAKVEVGESNDCWKWIAGGRKGYGQIWDPRVGCMVGPHRISYELKFGAIPQGMLLHHTCENKLCVNPDHLVCMSQSEHSRLHETHLNGARAMRNRTHCHKGHPYDSANTLYKKNGSRYCKTCHAARNRSWYQRKYAS